MVRNLEGANTRPRGPGLGRTACGEHCRLVRFLVSAFCCSNIIFQLPSHSPIRPLQHSITATDDLKNKVADRRALRGTAPVTETRSYLRRPADLVSPDVP